MKAILQDLFAMQPLSYGQAKAALLGIATEAYNPAQVASFVTVFQMRPIQLDELAGFRDALLELAVPFDTGGQATLDIVGTGGDGKDTFNISTTAALVVAAAGYKVTKHGSYGVSSSVGSSDVLLALGYSFSNDQDVLRRQLDEAGICFLHAPLFHPALKAVVPIRRELGMKTFFNMLGPLVNPVQPAYNVLGTFSMELSRLYYYAMQNTGRAYSILHALDGYDEVSLTGGVKVRSSSAERILYPIDFGLPNLKAADLYGGADSAAAKSILLNVLHNRATPAQTAAVLANAALAIQTICPEKSLPHCVEEAREAIANGKAAEICKRLFNG